MTHNTKTQIDEILNDKSLNHQQKIDAVMKLQEEARDIQRAATESGMDPDDGLNNDLRKIDLMLEQLGASTDDTGAATL